MNNFEKRLDEILGSLDIESDMSADDSGNYWIGGKDEAKEAIRTLILEEVIGDDTPTRYSNEPYERIIQHENNAVNNKLAEQRQKVKGGNDE